MPKHADLKKVMVIGSGPIVIGQAAEFDYAGTQACQALREEGLEVVLVNSNPATIMTDPETAEAVYLEPLTPEFVARIIEKERPDGLLPTLGGQVGLNLAMELAKRGALEEFEVRLLGTPLTAIKKAEDRHEFKATMVEIGEPVPESVIVTDIEAALAFADEIGYPVIVRPAYTLGGSGGGIAEDQQALAATAKRGIVESPIGQILIEKSLYGYKEIEYEVIRDSHGNVITICNMENIDPVGIHTGDSIVVAPSQTLADKEYQMLRTASLNIISALGIEGGCNVQFALHPTSERYYVIEVNPRVSRSSALASKATGYPIAKVAAKIAIGLTLDEIRNPVTGTTYAGFEPTIDYCVLKIPRWPFDKFRSANRILGTQMKATGEVMSIARTFEAGLMKALRSLELGPMGLTLRGTDGLTEEQLDQRLREADDQRLWLLAEAMRRGYSEDKLHAVTGIDRWFLRAIERVVKLERELIAAPELTTALLRRCKLLGIGDARIAQIKNLKEEEVRSARLEAGLIPVYKMVDTCAAEFEATTPYYYSAYERGEDEVRPSGRQKILVLGSGPIRIGQGIEFDYCSVHCVWALRRAGYEAVIINNNPETVSTDFNTSDRLYFEPLVFEDVMNVVEREKPIGVVAQFGGQTAINLAGPLARAGVSILGTPPEEIDRAEDRKLFDRLLLDMDIPKPPGRTAVTVEGAIEIAEEIGYPVLVRPSYVLGGRAMEIVYERKTLEDYMAHAVDVSPERPILVDKYLVGREVEVDAISDGQDVIIPGIMEHVERAGVHSGDSIAVFPPQSLTQEEKNLIVEYTIRLARALKVRGLVNIQFVVQGGQVYVIEVNPRSSRTVPFLTKVTGIPMVNLATQAIMGKTLKEQGYSGGLWPEPKHIAIKAPVFSWSKLRRVDTSLGPEMKSTGEVMGIDENYSAALYKAFVAAGTNPPRGGGMLVTIADKDKPEAIPVIANLAKLGFKIYATSGTAAALAGAGIKATAVRKLDEGSGEILDLIKSGRVHLVLNTLTQGRSPERDGFQIRRTAVEHGVPCLTSLDTASAMTRVLVDVNAQPDLVIRPLQDYLTGVSKADGVA